MSEGNDWLLYCMVVGIFRNMDVAHLRDSLRGFSSHCAVRSHRFSR